MKHENNPFEISTLFHKANDLYEEKKYKEARKLYTEIVNVDPDHASAWNMLFCAEDDLGNNEVALECINRAIEIDPYWGMLYYNRGWLYRRRFKEYNLAITDYNKAIKLGYRTSGSYWGRGNSYEKTGRFDQALKDYTRAKNIDPKDPGCYYEMARMYIIKKDYEQAFDNYLESVKLAYPECNPRELVSIVNVDQSDEFKNACNYLLNNGFYLHISGNIHEKFIVLARATNYRIVIRPENIHIGKTMRKHLRKNLDRYELGFDHNFEEIFDRCEEYHYNKYKDNDMLKNFRLFFSMIKQNKDSPKPICVALYKDGRLVAGDIGIQIGRVYTSYFGYHDESRAGTVQLILIAGYLENNGVALWDLGPGDGSSYKIGLGAEVMEYKEYNLLFQEVNPELVCLKPSNKPEKYRTVTYA